MRPSTPSALARSKPRREIDGLTPGIPGSQRSSVPCSTSSRRPARGARSSRSCSQGASPSTPVTDGWPAAPHRHSASHREAHRQLRFGPGVLDRRQRVLDAPVDPLPRLDPVAQLDESEIGEPGRENAERRSIVALQVPGTSAPWPPFMQTTASLPSGPVERASAPVGRRPETDDMVTSRTLSAPVAPSRWTRRTNSELKRRGSRPRTSCGAPALGWADRRMEALRVPSTPAVLLAQPVAGLQRDRGRAPDR